MFNYIITIHNKQDLLSRVLEGIAACCSKHSKIIPVLDGCTDSSEFIVDEFTNHSGLNVEKVITPNIFEIRALNAGIERVKSGFIMTIQDDVILQEPALEEKVERLFFDTDPTLGIISPRHGVNIRRMSLLPQFRKSGFIRLMDIYDRVCRPEEAWEQSVRVEYGQLIYRMAAGGSPMIIPELVWKSIGSFDDALAPHMWHDIEYNLRSLRAGFKNAVYPLHFESKEEWGTMRQNSKTNPKWNSDLRRVSLRNMRYVWKKHGTAIAMYHSLQGRPSWMFL